MRYQVPALAAYEQDQGIFGACPTGYYNPSLPVIAVKQTPISTTGASAPAGVVTVKTTPVTSPLPPPTTMVAVKVAPSTSTAISATKLVAVPATTTTAKVAGYNAYGAPVVLHEYEEAGMSGGIFARGGSVGGLGDTPSVTQDQLTVWLSQAQTAADAIARQTWAALHPGQPPPKQTPTGGGTSPVQDDKILGLPAPVAILGGAAVIAALMLKKRG
jgi:hypothetical protein